MGADRGPTISLPTGGGVLRGISATFTPDPHTGNGKTSSGAPGYDGTDVFVLSGAEDLVHVPAGPGLPADAHSHKAASCASGSSTDWTDNR